jgi:hypothetical protein
MHSRSPRTLEVCLVALFILVCRTAAADVITLAWDASPEESVAYKLYVGTESGNYSQDIDVGTATTFAFSDAVPGQQYCFALTAYWSESLESEKSNEVCGFSNAPPTLDNPGTLSSTVGEPTFLQLTGTDPEGRPLTYSATGLPPGLSLMASTGYISGSGTTAGSYQASVTASDGVLSSSQSFTWNISPSGTLPPGPGPAPVALSAEAINRSWRDRVQLAWTTASWSEVWVYRDGDLIARTNNDGAFIDSIWQASGDYTYVVCAPDRSACSNDVTVDF